MPVLKVQPAILRKLNECRVLNSIRVNRTMSRADLQRDLNMAMPTVSRIVDSLIEQYWVREIGFGETVMGRPPVMLELNPKSPIAFGIELGREEIRFVMTNLLGDILHKEILELQAFKSPQSLVDYLVNFIAGKGIKISEVIGVGVAAPGAIDPHPELPSRSEYDMLPAWQSERIDELIVQQLGVPAWIENDANAAVLGELWFGAGSSMRHLVFVYSDEGLGAGIAVNGSLFKGENNCAGEFGHTIVDAHSEIQCVCGRYGCVASLSDIMHVRNMVKKARHGDVPTIDEIFSRARAGIEPEAEIMKDAIKYLAIGIINLVQTIDPAVVILGGKGFLANNYTVEELQRQLQSVMNSRKTPIVVTSFGVFAVAVGAATLVLQGVFDHTQLIDLPQ